MNGFLQLYDVELTTRAPMHIGSGKSYNKKSYIFDAKKRNVRIVDDTRLLNVLLSGGFAASYEQFIMCDTTSQLGDFLKECGFTEEQLNEITLYTTDAADALTEGKPLMEIHQFMRNAHNRPYVPGSSLKGALRTAILMKLIERGNKMPLNPRGQTSRDVEPAYLNTLALNHKRPKDEVNSIMRGISVSDSEAINADKIILARKADISVHGNERPVNTVREAVMPGVKIKFKLTLDTSVKGVIDEDFIRDAVSSYGDYYRKTYAARFKLPDNAVSENFENCLVLGGGAGYFGKNIVYPMLGYHEGLAFTAELMRKKFPKHYHEKDVQGGVSPHMLKFTAYKSRGYHFGVCAFAMVRRND